MPCKLQTPFTIHIVSDLQYANKWMPLIPLNSILWNYTNTKLHRQTVCWPIGTKIQLEVPKYHAVLFASTIALIPTCNQAISSLIPIRSYSCLSHQGELQFTESVCMSHKLVNVRTLLAHICFFSAVQNWTILQAW
jgi:hypothetical protein